MSARTRFLLASILALVPLVASVAVGCSSAQSHSASGARDSPASVEASGPTAGSSSANGSGRAPWASPDFEVVPATVLRVVDGDTAVMEVGSLAREERVRFIGVDTPESTIEHEPFGEEACAYTEKYLDGKRVWLQIGTEQRDRYGRLPAYVWLEQPLSASESEVRAKQFNAHLLLAGYAQLLTIPPDTDYAVMYRTFQAEARDSSLGLWGLSSADLTQLAPTSDDGAAGEDGPQYIGNSNSKKFHLATCKYAAEMKEHHKAPFTAREEAIAAGYIPCKNCQP